MNLICNELTKRGWPVSLVPINSSVDDFVKLTCEVFPIDRQWQAGLWDTFFAIHKFTQIVKVWKPDIVILNCDLPELFGVFISTPAKLIAVEHVNRPWVTRTHLGKVVRKLLKYRGLVWAAVSSHLRIWPDNHNPVAVLINPIVPWRVIPISDSSKTSPLESLIFIGRLAPQKRPEWLLEIAFLTDFPMRIIGEGPLSENLKEKATAKMLNINFEGQIEQPWSSVSSGDLLIVPSEYEGDGLVVIEGLGQGIPMLLADIPDFRRFNFPDRNYCKDAKDFAIKIREYSNHINDLKIPKELRDKILAARSLEVVGNSWEEFLTTFIQ